MLLSNSKLQTGLQTLIHLETTGEVYLGKGMTRPSLMREMRTYFLYASTII